MDIALINRSSMSPRDFAFAARAIEIQMTEDLMPLWRDHLEDKNEWPVFGVSSADGLSKGSFSPISILDDIGRDAALGFHDWTMGAWGRSLPLVPTMSHEATELRIDPKINRWFTMPDGRQCAGEVADPVQEDTYDIEVTIGGETREVAVSNFVTPAWFGLGEGRLYDYLGLCDRPFHNRGYLIVKNPNGTMSFEYSSRMGRASMPALAAEKVNPRASRTAKRLGR